MFTGKWVRHQQTFPLRVPRVCAASGTRLRRASSGGEARLGKENGEAVRSANPERTWPVEAAHGHRVADSGMADRLLWCQMCLLSAVLPPWARACARVCVWFAILPLRMSGSESELTRIAVRVSEGGRTQPRAGIYGPYPSRGLLQIFVSSLWGEKSVFKALRRTVPLTCHRDVVLSFRSLLRWTADWFWPWEHKPGRDLPFLPVL